MSTSFKFLPLKVAKKCHPIKKKN